MHHDDHHIRHAIGDSGEDLRETPRVPEDDDAVDNVLPSGRTTGPTDWPTPLREVIASRVVHWLRSDRTP
jgi:hypothetical protein